MSAIVVKLKRIIKANRFLRQLVTPFVDKNIKWQIISLLNRPFLYKLLNGERIKLYPQGQIARGIFSGWFEADDLIKFQKFVKEGMTVIDIGANIGLYTIVASRLIGKKGKVFSFEPSGSTYGLFQRNMDLNGVSNFSAYNIGIGDVVNQTMELRLDNGSGDADKYLIPEKEDLKKQPDSYITDQAAEIEKITLDTLDNILSKEEIKTVDFVKIDTEGYEYFVIKGAKEILMNSPNVIVFMECTGPGTKRVGVSQEMVYEVLKSYGLSLFSWDGTNHKWSNDEKVAKADGMIWACRNMQQLTSVIQ